MTLGIDAGGTYLRYEIRKDDKIVNTSSIKSSEIGLSEYIENILQKENAIEDICISYAGQVKDGVILASPNIKLDRQNIQEYFKENWGVNLFIQNDLNCAALAEAKDNRSENICALYVGSGVGLGVVSSGILVKGSNQIATELGHIPYKDSPFTCGCGKKNCIELFASGLGLDNWKSYYDLDNSLTLQELKNSKNQNERKIYEEFLEALLYAVGSTITLFHPEILVLGGGIILNNCKLCEIITSNIHKYAMPISLKKIKIKNSKIKNASLEGAFLLKDYNNV